METAKKEKFETTENWSRFIIT